MVTSLRRRALSDIVAHPLFTGLVISSARATGQRAELRIRRSKEIIELADVSSTGAGPSDDLFEILEKQGVQSISRVARNAIARMDARAREILAGRFAIENSAHFEDLMGLWRPYRLDTAILDIHSNGLLDVRTVHRRDDAQYANGELHIKVPENQHYKYRRERLYDGATRAGKYVRTYQIHDNVMDYQAFASAARNG